MEVWSELEISLGYAALCFAFFTLVDVALEDAHVLVVMVALQRLTVHQVADHLGVLDVEHFVIELLELPVGQASSLLFEPVCE